MVAPAMSRSDRTVRLNVTLPVETVERIETLAAEEGVSKSEIARRAVLQMIDAEIQELRLFVQAFQREIDALEEVKAEAARFSGRRRSR